MNYPEFLEAINSSYPNPHTGERKRNCYNNAAILEAAMGLACEIACTQILGAKT